MAVDPTYNAKNYDEQGGGRSVRSGRVAHGAAAEDIALQASFTIGAEATNVINVAVQLLADADNNIAAMQVVRAYLSDDSGGDGIAATAPDGGLAIGTDGAILVEDVADKMFTVLSEADGDFDIDITESSADTWYLVVIFGDGRIAVSGAITFA